MYWLNGQPAENVSLADRAMHYGDGFFTTALVQNGQVHLLARHLQRLQQTAKRLLFPPVPWDILQEEMRQAAHEQGAGVLKVILSRGSGQRGYSIQGCETPNRLIQTSAAPTHYSTWQEQGVTLGISALPLARSPLLAGLKHLNRLEQVLIRADLERQQVDEVLVCDTEGILVECCSANLFWRKGKQVFTPSLEWAGVAGVMRAHILQHLSDRGVPLTIVCEPVSTLQDADEILLCNALLPIVPVHRIAERCYTSRQLFDHLLPLLKHDS